MRQKDLAITINLQNHTIKIKTTWMIINPLNSKLNLICHLLALLAAHHILHVSGIRVKAETGKQGKNKELIKPGKINPNAFNNYFLKIAENTTHTIPTQTSDNRIE